MKKKRLNLAGELASMALALVVFLVLVAMLRVGWEFGGWLLGFLG